MLLKNWMKKSVIQKNSVIFISFIMRPKQKNVCLMAEMKMLLNLQKKHGLPDKRLRHGRCSGIKNLLHVQKNV